MKVSLEKLQSLEAGRELIKSEQIGLEKTAKASAHKDILVPLLVEEKKQPNENIHGNAKNRINRRALIKNTAPEPVDFAFERAIGNNDSVFSNFIELILGAKQKVGRIAVIENNTVSGYATGFMVSDTLMLTNWHVLSTKVEARFSTIEFNYEYDVKGNLKESITFALDPESFFYSNKALDYCLVAVKSRDLTNEHDLARFGSLYLSPLSGKLGDLGKEALNIIHHPDGDPKQLSIRENTFVRVLSNAIWYESDTAQGSSGSPVFNDQFQVVALHHMGIASKNNAGDYLDKNGDPIMVDANNKIDISKIHWIANEGIRISVIRKDLEENHSANPLVQQVLNRPHLRSFNDINPTPIMINAAQEAHDSNIVQINMPSSLIKSEKSISFNVSSKMQSGEIQVASDLRSINDIDIETLTLERNIDYSDCRGYKSNFLGSGEKSIGIPKPTGIFWHRKAKLIGGNSYVLKYHKFSVIFDSFHQMPFISAINVDGNLDLRQDKTKRVDKWIRDRRISLSIQLDDDFYYKSGFDRGHMSRREDANWGETPKEAKRNADLTCVHTNACPQVPTLNRSNKSGLWGKLEKIILEKGAEKEDGKTGKITVFSGPIFSDSDPVFRGVSIPMKFYKVILWLTNGKQLKATAFILSQSDLVSSIEFEAIDIDQDVQFKEHQVSIQHLQDLTHLDFGEVISFDTYIGDNPEFEITSEEEMLERILI
ncbi:MAG: hypothetical protein HKN09_03175 [Saprospiraceae bacterium]|nr:hypothetical protein [Saprospiraceae bacterium]